MWPEADSQRSRIRAIPAFSTTPTPSYHRALTQMPWYRDLELERHGAVYLEPELNVALVLKSGEVLEWWRSFEKTEESFSRFSGKDAVTLRRWRERFLPIVRRSSFPRASLLLCPAIVAVRCLKAALRGVCCWK